MLALLLCACSQEVMGPHGRKPMLLSGTERPDRAPGSLLRADPGYIQWLERQSMLGNADDLAAEVSGSERLWGNSGSNDRLPLLLDAAPCWLEVNPHTLRGKATAMQSLARSGTLEAFRRMGFSGLYLSPSQEQGALWHNQLRPDFGTGTTSLAFDARSGDDEQFARARQDDRGDRHDADIDHYGRRQLCLGDGFGYCTGACRTGFGPCHEFYRQKDGMRGAIMSADARKKIKIKPFTIVNAVIMVVLCIVFILPFWMMITASFSGDMALIKNGLSLWFQDFSVSAYAELFATKSLLRSLGVTLVVSLGTAVLSVFVCTGAAYVLSKKKLAGRKLLTWYFMIPMFFGGGTIPLYLVIRELGLYDHIWALILPNVVSIYNIVLVRNYFYSLPESLSEAADLDGANEMQMLLHVFFPLAVPMMLTIGLITFVGRWNSWLDSLMYLSVQNDGLWMIQYTLRKILENNPADPSPASVKNAAIVIVVAPLIIASPILHRFLANGVTAGAVKG